MPDPYRPQLHFSPARGWMNDPNGLIKIDGFYHMFFQHDPVSINHGPMHWGHARSSDLVTWEELPIALYPTELGTCFSGTAVETDEGEIKLFYTAHRRISDEDYQVQCLVHADRSLTTFRLDAANPVLDNPGLSCFRDPKVLWHVASGRWIMATTLGQSVGFYSSPDQIDWHFESSFGENHGRHSEGPWECPDLIPMTDAAGDDRWILIVGIGSGAYAAGSGTQYFVGQFDGHNFTNANPPSTTLWLDYGRDFYAAQSFSSRDGSAPVVLAWASNWQYARHTPTKVFRNVMSYPRTLSLVETRHGARLAQSLPKDVASALNAATNPAVYLREIELDLAVGQSATITLFAESRPHFMFSRITSGEASIVVSRQQTDEMPAFGHRYSVPATYPDQGPLRLKVCVDHGVVEMATADGVTWITQLFFPSNIEGGLSVELTSSN